MKRSKYSEQLLEIARRFKALPAMGLGVVSSNRVSALEQRIRCVLRESPTSDPSRVMKGIGLSFGLGLLISIAGFQTHGRSGRAGTSQPASAPGQLIVVKGKWADRLQ